MKKATPKSSPNHLADDYSNLSAANDLGRKVVYDRVVLEEWLNQFTNQPNTSA